MVFCKSCKLHSHEPHKTSFCSCDINVWDWDVRVIRKFCITEFWLKHAIVLYQLWRNKSFQDGQNCRTWKCRTCNHGFIRPIAAFTLRSALRSGTQRCAARHRATLRCAAQRGATLRSVARRSALRSVAQRRAAIALLCRQFIYANNMQM